MNKNIIFIGLVLGIILVSGCVPTEKTYLQNVLTEDPVVINEDISGAPSSPMDLVLTVTQFSEDKTSEITVKVGMRTGYKTEWFEARNTSIRIYLPEGLEIPGCPSPQCELAAWRGDIIGDQVEELKVSVKAVKNGQWVIEASALSADFPGYDYVGDTEKVYILVEDQRVLISDISFTLPTPGEKAGVSFSDLITNTQRYNGSEICTSGIYLSRCELRLLGESYYEEDGFIYLTEPKIWVESMDVQKRNCFEGPPCFGPSRIEYPKFCNANVCGIFEYGPLIIQTASYQGDYLIKSLPSNETPPGGGLETPPGEAAEE